MQTFFYKNFLWDEIAKNSKEAKKNTIIVSYLSNLSSKYISWKNGDELFVNMSNQTLLTRGTNPNEVQRLYNKGVTIYNCENLHAKVYIFDNIVLNCSANLSINSQSNLIESGTISVKKKITEELNNFLAMVRVNSSLIEKKDFKYFISVFDRGRKEYKSPRNVTTNTKDKNKLWVINFTDWKKDTSSNKIISEQLGTQKIDVELTKRFNLLGNLAVESIFDLSNRWENVKINDWIIQVYKNNVYAPVRILSKKEIFLKKTKYVVISILKQENSTFKYQFLKALIKKIYSKEKRGENFGKINNFNNIKLISHFKIM